jgi:hypothetical protein
VSDPLPGTPEYAELLRVSDREHLLELLRLPLRASDPPRAVVVELELLRRVLGELEQ